MRVHLRLIVSVCLLSLLPALASADGIDLVPYFTRVGFHNSVPSVPVVCILILLFMTFNYLLNFIFIGFPAMRLGNVNTRIVTRDLIFLTIAGQIADRLGAILAAFSAGPLTYLLNLKGEDVWVIPLLILNFFFSGVAIAVLAFFFCRRKWKLPLKISLIIVTFAAIFTNPAYVIFLNWK